MFIIEKILTNAILGLFFAILEKMPEWVVSKVLDSIGKKAEPVLPKGVMLFSPTCGDKAIDLAHQRLLISSAFGSYFTGLLEREQSYVYLKGQIVVSMPVERRGLEPIQSIYWALQYPRGPRVLIIAAEGGMGKSTLATKIIRCLYEEQAVDMILGDSAKTQRFDPISGTVIDIDPAYYDPQTFYETVYSQLGLPYKRGEISAKRAVQEIRNRIEGRHAIIAVDNLESVSQGAELLNVLRQIASRDTRVIITTRSVSGLMNGTTDILLIYLKPISEFSDAHNFLRWHIRTHADEHPGLLALEKDIEDKRKVGRLLKHTGGIPLLIQLVVSDIARFSWDYLDNLPHLFGKALLNFLYHERWLELGNLGKEGLHARRLLQFISSEQYRGKKITFERIRRWNEEINSDIPPQAGLQLLQERFLVVNHDPKQGNFAVFPSLAEFLRRQSPVST